MTTYRHIVSVQDHEASGALQGLLRENTIESIDVAIRIMAAWDNGDGSPDDYSNELPSGIYTDSYTSTNPKNGYVLVRDIAADSVSLYIQEIEE